jgi:hypothetical protein
MILLIKIDKKEYLMLHLTKKQFNKYANFNSDSQFYTIFLTVQCLIN